MLQSSTIPTTFCSFSPYRRNPNSPSSANHPLFLRFRTSHLENLRYLKSIGVVNPETYRSNRKPTPETLAHILSTVNSFKSKGFSDSDFARIAFLCPDIFSSAFEFADIEPVFEFLTVDLGATAEESHGLIIRCPKLLESNAEFRLRPALLYLRNLGLENLNSPTTLNAHLLNTRIDKLKETVQFLRWIGFSHAESATFCVRLPAVFGYSIEHNLMPKYEYLVREMKRNLEELHEFPQYFGYSLRRRIIPRHLHLKQRNVQLPLKRLLLWGDQKFYNKWK